MMLIKNAQAEGTSLLGKNIGEGTNILIKDGSICPGGVCDWAALVSWVTTVLFFVAAVACFMFLIAGGIGFITSGGDKGKLESSRNKIMFSIIGMIVVAASYAIWRLVLTIIGVDGSINTGL